MVTTATVDAYSVEEAAAKVDAIHKAFGTNVDIDLTILADETADEQAAKTLSYAFNWLKSKAQEETNMTGAIEYNIITDMTKLPQRIASAASAIETAEITGASYKPLMYVGAQVVRGTNHWFICEQTLVTAHPEKHIVTLAVNEFQGLFALVGKSIHRIDFEISE